jgi:hypothetical protein
VDERGAAQHAAAELAAVLGEVFAALDDLVRTTEELLAAPRPVSDDLRELDPLAITAVRGDALIVGAGYVAAPDALADAKYWLQWWSDYDIPRTGRPQRLQVELDPYGELFRDYTELPWFAVPAKTGVRHITGPYVDYLCTDEYTLTCTVPVRAHGVFAGVVGADVYAHDFERITAPQLARIDGPSALLNTSGRVVAASGSAHVTGDLVRQPEVLRALRGPADAEAYADCGVHHLDALPFAVVVGPAVAG